MARHVQHISGQGKRWELADDGRICNTSMNHPTWVVWEAAAGSSIFYLPKSEYRVVEPPEKWVDVTEHCVPEQSSNGNINLLCFRGARYECVNRGYRLRKICVTPLQELGEPFVANRTAFIVEKRES